MAYPSGSTTDNNSELFAALVTAAQFAAYETSVARQMVTVFDAPYNAGKSLQVPVWAGIDAQLLTDEEAATVKTTNTTSASITLDEHVVYHMVTDRLRDSAYNDVMAQLGDQSGRAIAESMDKQVFGLFTSFSTDLGPGAGAELHYAVTN
jgi:protein-arginine kinase